MQPARHMSDTTYFTYIVRCADGTLYTGWTVDLEKRLSAHNQGRGARYTSGRRPVTLAASWAFASKAEAMSFEFRLKSLSRRRKEEMIASSGDKRCWP